MNIIVIHVLEESLFWFSITMCIYTLLMDNYYWLLA